MKKILTFLVVFMISCFATSMSAKGLTIPEYNNVTQKWQINTGEELQYALAKAVDGDTFVIMENLHMGADCEITGHTHNDPNMDGISEELVVGPGGDSFQIDGTTITRNNLQNATLNFISGTGNEIKIYRNDHKRHLAIGKFTYNASTQKYSYSTVNMNVTLNFDDVTLDGNQTYDVNDVIKQNIKNSSRGGVAIYQAENVTLNGINVVNSFGDTMNANISGKVYMGRDTIANGGALNGWYAKNLVVDNSHFEGNYSGGIGGAFHLQGNGGTIKNTIIKDNHSLRFEAYGSGGGILYQGVSDAAKLENVTIDGNSAIGVDPSSYDYGGGVAFIASGSGTLEIKDSVISNNLSQRGGAMIFSGNTTLENVDILNNTATDETRKEKATSNAQPVGGGLAAAGGVLTLKGDVNISGNKIVVGKYSDFGQGAGMSLGGVTTDPAANVVISDNKGVGTNGASIYGGGAYLSIPASNTDISNWMVKDNINDSTEALGGGVFASINAGNLTADNLNLINNSSQYGGGLFLNFNSSSVKTATIENSNITGNTALRPVGLADTDDTGSGAGIYTTNYEKLFTNKVTFENNNAMYGGAQPDPSDTDYAITMATYNSNILNNQNLSAPFEVTKDYAYNNHDINYVGNSMIHQITYHANGGVGSHIVAAKKATSHIIKDSSEVNISREGHRFVKWNTKVDGTGTNYNVGESFTVSQNVILYAQWEKVNTDYEDVINDDKAENEKSQNTNMPKTGSMDMIVTMPKTGSVDMVVTIIVMIAVVGLGSGYYLNRRKEFK